MAKEIVDVHAHFLADEYLLAVKNAGEVDKDGNVMIDNFPIPEWRVEAHLETMKANGIAKCILSAPEIHTLKNGEALKRLARSLNDYAKKLKDEYAEHFGVFTTVPLPDTDAALEEIAYGFDELGFDGVCLHTNYHNKYLGDEAFAPVMDELNKRKAIVFVHPISPEHENITLGVTGAMLEFPFDSTRNVMTLIKSGTLERCPDIKFIITHGGGTLPYLAPRIAALLAMGQKQKQPQQYVQEVIKQIQSLYFDLTAATHPAAMGALKVSMPAEHLLMGFDFPLMPPMMIPMALKNFNDAKTFNDEEKELIVHKNWESLKGA